MVDTEESSLNFRGEQGQWGIKGDGPLILSEHGDNRQRNKEGRALSFDRLAPDPSPMPLNEGATEVESSSRTCNSRGAGVLRLHKALENLLLLLCWNTEAVIAHRKEGLLFLDLLSDGHVDGAALWTLLDRISDQVPEDLFYALGINGRDEPFYWPRGVFLTKRYDVPDNCKLVHTRCLFYRLNFRQRTSYQALSQA